MTGGGWSPVVAQIEPLVVPDLISGAYPQRDVPLGSCPSQVDAFTPNLGHHRWGIRC
jgi:hypothetical protein